MSNDIRDKYLTEAMGKCWHKFEQEFWWGNRCITCGQDDNYIWQPKNINFSTWEGFGKLWEWIQEQQWQDDFITGLECEQDTYNRKWLHPNKFADEVYTYLKEHDHE